MAIGGDDFKGKQSKHFNQSRYIKVYYRGMEEWPGGQEHFLFLEITQIWFKAPTWQPMNAYNSGSRGSDVPPFWLLWASDM